MLRRIERRAYRMRVYVEPILPAPTRRIRVVLNGTQSPFGLPCHGVYGNLAQKTNLPVTACAELHSLHQCFQIWWIAFAPDFHADLVPVGRIFVAVDGVTHLAQIAPKFRFSLPNDGILL